MRGRCVAAPSSSVLQPPQSQPARPKASLDLDSVGGAGEGQVGGGTRPGGGKRNNQGQGKGKGKGRGRGRGKNAVTVGR